MHGLIAGAVIIATAVLSVGASPAVAQTLADPNPKSSAPPPALTTKSHAAGHVKNCSAYGPGFMAMPGSTMCIKIGGGVTVEARH